MASRQTQEGFPGRRIALGAVALLLIAVGGAFFSLPRYAPPVEAPPSVAEVGKEPNPARKPVMPTVDSMILVRLRSTPAGAAVFDGNVQIGTTPLDRRLRRNEVHELTFRLANHRDVRRKLDFNGVLSDAQDVSVTLEPVKTVPAEPSRSSRSAKQDENDPISIPIFE